MNQGGGVRLSTSAVEYNRAVENSELPKHLEQYTNRYLRRGYFEI